jgi:uncharacterized protein (TIGR02145 family)
MKNFFLVIAIFCMLKTNAQNYLITFIGSGESATVSTVIVENLTTGLSLTLNGNDILNLTLPTGVNSIENKQSSEIKIFPNPAANNTLFQFRPPSTGDATITVSDMNGKQVAQIQSYLEDYLQEFRLSGINKGLYMISVSGRNYRYSGKLLVNGKAGGTIGIEKIGINQAADEKPVINDPKGIQATVDMAYNVGDRLKYTGISGIYSTVKMDIPAGDNAVTFNFIACSDGDNNNYPVVSIGTQTWMAANLKTTKYKDGITSIPNVTVDGDWIALTTPAYCWYSNNSAAYKDTYGALYNWYTVGTGNLCPTAWHVPTDDEWLILIDYLGGENVAGGKLKESGTTHWYSPNTGATNETGFTSLPGGYRWSNGAFSDLGGNDPWWSATEYLPESAYNRRVYYLYNDILRYFYNKMIGFSVRCVKDN